MSSYNYPCVPSLVNSESGSLPPRRTRWIKQKENVCVLNTLSNRKNRNGTDNPVSLTYTVPSNVVCKTHDQI